MRLQIVSGSYGMKICMKIGIKIGITIGMEIGMKIGMMTGMTIGMKKDGMPVSALRECLPANVERYGETIEEMGTFE